MPNNANLATFPIAQLRLILRAKDVVNLPEFSGSTWRGALGQALRRLACVCPGVECKICVMQPMCWYAKLYEPILASRCGVLQGQREAPHPLIPRPTPVGGKLMPHTTANLDLLLIGQAQEATPLLVQAAQRMVKHGIGLNRGELELVYWELTALPWQPWQPPALWPQVRIVLETPLRLRIDNRVVTPQMLTLRPLLTTLLRRMSLFSCCHGAAPLEVDFRALAEVAELIAITERRLDWFRWQRYSSRQQRHIAMDGVVGSLEIDLAQAPDWWPFLWAGQWLHVGKGASMGMGRYRLEAM